jgi:hypothetical protein
MLKININNDNGISVAIDVRILMPVMPPSVNSLGNRNPLSPRPAESTPHKMRM